MLTQMTYVNGTSK